MLLISELIGLFGGFTRIGLGAGALLVALTVVIVTRRAHDAKRDDEPLPAPPASGTLVIAVAATTALAVHWTGSVRQSFEIGMYKQDGPWYHLSDAARFVQDGGFGALHFTDPLKLAAWFFPLNSEVFHSVGMAAIASDALSPLINLGWMVLALLAAWCIGRPFGLGLPTLLGAGIVFGSTMMLPQAGSAASDMPSLFFLLATIAILINADAAAAESSPSWGAIGIAGLAAGLAAGTKITLLPAIGALTVIVLFLARDRGHPRVAWAWVVGALLTSSFWYARNLLSAGNPFPWFDAGPLPGPDQLPIYPRPQHSFAEVALDPEVWSQHLVHGFRVMLGPAWPVVLLGAAAGLILVLARPRSRLHQSIAAAGVISAIAYAFTPITASGFQLNDDYSGFASNLRYLAPALAIGLILAPLAEPFRGRARRISLAYGAIALATVLNAGSWGVRLFPGGLMIALAFVLVPVGSCLLLQRRVGVRAVSAALAGCFVALAVLGHSIERDYLGRRYDTSRLPLAQNPGYRATPQWRRMIDWAEEQHDTKIGIVGLSAAFGQYLFYGNNLSNEVDYIGEPLPHGGFRPITNCQEWRSAVNTGGYDYLLATPAVQSATGPDALEAKWTRGDPAVTLAVPAGSGAVFRVNGRLDPAGCPDA